MSGPTTSVPAASICSRMAPGGIPGRCTRKFRASTLVSLTNSQKDAPRPLPVRLTPSFGRRRMYWFAREAVVARSLVEYKVCLHSPDQLRWMRTFHAASACPVERLHQRCQSIRACHPLHQDSRYALGCPPRCRDRYGSTEDRHRVPATRLEGTDDLPVARHRTLVPLVRLFTLVPGRVKVIQGLRQDRTAATAISVD